jgi:DNA polymerase-3 subunit gamma/tau
MRDALSIFDQAASFCQGNITYQKVIEDLNVLDSEYYFRLVDYCLENKVTEAMVLLNDIINKGFDGGLLIQGLAKHVRNVLMAKDPQTLPLLEVSEQQRQRYQEQAKRCPTPYLYKGLQLMNQCDINYRQSSNKRLLVELTLIEVAQITQPEEGGASGRKPRRLKSLFKNLMQQTQPKTAVPQVTAASSVSSPAAPAAATATAETPKSEAVVQQPRPALKADSIGVSWNNLRKMSLKPSKMNIPPGIMGTEGQSREDNFVFSQEDLELQWMAMCNRMPQQLIGIATRMKNMNPTITEMPKVVVVVGNDLIRQEMEQIHGSIVNTLKRDLHNSSIVLDIVVDEHHDEVKILTRREQFTEMVKANSAVEKLRTVFDLELA